MPNRELNGWKEIAGYLRVEVRTAQKWEKPRRLPIRRLRNRVYSSTDALDEWRLTESHRSKLSHKPMRFKWLAAGVAMAVLVAWLVWLATRPGLPATWRVTESTLHVLDAKGKTCWKKSFPRLLTRYYQGNYYTRNVLIADLDSDGRGEVLFSEIPAGIRDSTSGTLHAFSAAGETLWQLPYGEVKIFEGNSLPPHYESRILRVAHVQGQTYIILSITHNRFPSQVLLINPKSGHVIEDYWHPGHLNAALIRDVDDDGEDELLLGGNNNPGVGLGHAGLVLLELPFKDNPRPLPDHFPIQFTGGAANRYFLFPTIDAAAVLGDSPSIRRITYQANQYDITVEVLGGQVLYQLDQDFALKGVWPGDGLLRTRRELQLKGHLPPGDVVGLGTVLAFPATPNANHDAINIRFRSITQGRNTR